MKDSRQINNKLSNRTLIKVENSSSSHTIRTNSSITIKNNRINTNQQESSSSLEDIKWVMKISSNHKVVKSQIVNTNTNTRTTAKASEKEHLAASQNRKPSQTFKLGSDNQASNT